MNKKQTEQFARDFAASERFCKALKHAIDLGKEACDRTVVIRTDDPAGPYLRVIDKPSHVLFRIYLKKSENVAIKAHGLYFSSLKKWLEGVEETQDPFARNTMSDMTFSFRLKEGISTIDQIFKRINEFIIQCTEDPTLTFLPLPDAKKLPVKETTIIDGKVVCAYIGELPDKMPLESLVRAGIFPETKQIALIMPNGKVQAFTEEKFTDIFNCTEEQLDRLLHR